ncbi:hypothetical protein C3747_114g19 [Trypanosoma cruzi]|uniref:Uncharacterized protein n=2 Tax=Trypanosoma cruzi TaxID=5693 RepID=Q4E4B4_TRYCC|nr:hypothetical protein, conserved [Trypanosoma cruzi]EAN99648.1 hypothetical protein, conserved [Trypanosoma cruzi]PWV06469.1 hypothetical protein C3747_114g19 [Trypanosoma cruzi]|eukprot:XP_821499.1 hypothetical protein [Trypanosoma cruzi strain CL Brener]
MKRSRFDGKAPSFAPAVTMHPQQQQRIEERGANNRVVVNSPYGCSRARYGWGMPFHTPLLAYVPGCPAIHIGISSLSGVPGRDRRMKTLFAQYAKKFNSLEHCYTFHNMGEETMWKNWRDMCASQLVASSSHSPASLGCVQTSDNGNQKSPPFIFSIKANQYLTHTRMLAIDDKSEEHIMHFFVNRCSILGRHLGPVLLQLPPQFQKNHVNMERIEAVAARIPKAFSVAVEFRHRSWYDEGVYALLRRLGWALVVAHHHDDPTASVHVDTGVDFMYVRLHGPIGLHIGDYGPVILSQWAERVVDYICGGVVSAAAADQSQPMAVNAHGREVYFFFNNSDSHVGGTTSSTVDATFLAQRVGELLAEKSRSCMVADSQSNSCSDVDVVTIISE